MTGKRHHILPRFLLSGFASKTTGDGKIFTWVYSKNHDPREISTKDVSVEKHFYGRDGEVNVDPEITELEKEFASLVRDLREKSGEVIDPRIAKFITHLCTRTKYLRDSVVKIHEFQNEFLDEHFSSSENIKNRSSNSPQIIQALCKDYNIPPQQRDIFAPVLQLIICNHLDKYEDEFKKISEEYFSEVKQAQKNEVKKSHLETLSQNLLPVNRVEKYDSLKWFVCDSSISLVLGDVGCLFKISGNRYKPLDDKKDKIKNIFLPISSNKMLVGTSSHQKPKIDFNHLITIYVEYSREFFICSKSSQKMKSLRFSLGKKAGILTNEEMKKMTTSTILSSIPYRRDVTSPEIEPSFFHFFSISK